MSFVDAYEFQGELAKKHQAKGRADSVLTVLRTRGLPVHAQHEERIRACGDSKQLDRWLQRAVTASSPDEIFAE